VVDPGEEVRFALDSPLEGGGFEPSVPVASEPVYIAEGELRGIDGAAPKILRGTDGSNPSPSSGESAHARFPPERSSRNFRELTLIAGLGGEVDGPKLKGKLAPVGGEAKLKTESALVIGGQG
jgi:hypothetical protein